MRITEEMQNYQDIEWFAVDDSGCIASFTSGGTKLPESVAEDYEGNLLLVAYFDGLSERCRKVNADNEASTDMVGSNDPLELAATIGLFAYDADLNGRFVVSGYTRGGVPKVARRLDDVPVEIRVVLSRTRFLGDFMDHPRIDPSRIL